MWIARALLILTAISLITMPVTQHLWTWDHFLHGGRDFELSTLMILSFLGLVLVLSKNLKTVHRLIVIGIVHARISLSKRVTITDHIGYSRYFVREYVASSDRCMYSIPLLI